MKTYLRHRSLNVVDVKGLVALEYLDFEGKYKNYVEKHDFCELCYVEKGEINISLEKGTKKATQNELVFIEPNVTHSYLSNNGNENKVFVMCFECVSSTLKALSGVNFRADEECEYCLKKIIEETSKTFKMNKNDQLEIISSTNFGGYQAIILQLEYLLISLLRRLSSNESSSVVFLNEKSFQRDLVNIVREYLDTKIKTKITLNDVCKKLNYSRSYICKIFKEQTGETLISYFYNLKIEEAKKLLAQTNLPASKISEILAFSEAKYFASVFKKIVGLSPIAFRNSLKKG